MNELQLRAIIEEYSQSQNMMLLSADGVILSGLNDIGQTYAHFEEINKPVASLIRNVGGEEQIVVKKMLPLTGWMLVSLTPYEAATSQVYEIFRSNFLIEIGFVALFLVILIYLLRQFTKPILRLVQVAASIEAGNLSIRSHITGSNEFVKLGRSFDNMLDSIETMVRQITYEQELKRKAELAMLQAQINPHFLFNILNAVRLRIMLRGDRENADVISSLSHLLRMTFINNREFISLQEEVELVKQYMNLMNFTSKDAFRYEIDLSSETLHELVPRFILQPMIENAIIHGLRQYAGNIRIRAWKEDKLLVIAVEDDGGGMAEATVAELRQRLQGGVENSAARPETNQGMSGFGLFNVYERLTIIYGDRFRMDMKSELGKGTVIYLFIPNGGEKRAVESADGG
ncbi:sensor histidine kinase [Gordoniibacillus kamchatkensis]|uniref:sensor histidine kinase n=1 Tax=Gordoniibacillus kamchatkensis TaxID=1590651 RepID=UPI0012E02C4A|nr:histidine kinase [Paenibacillus sp. VKM B-2647]